MNYAFDVRPASCIKEEYSCLPFIGTLVSKIVARSRWRGAKVPATEIALRLDRHRSTIFRELSRDRFVDAERQHLSGYYALNDQTIATDRWANLRKMVRHLALRIAIVMLALRGTTTLSLLPLPWATLKHVI